MQVWVFTVLLFSILNKVNTSPTRNDTEDEKKYSCQKAFKDGMYGCYDTSNMTVDGIKFVMNNFTQKETDIYKLINTSTAAVTKATVLQPILDYECIDTPIKVSRNILGQVAVDPIVRSAAQSIDEKIYREHAEISFMKNVYNKFKVLNDSLEKWNFTEEEVRYVKKFLRDRKRNGINLGKQEQEKLKKLFDSIRQTVYRFTTNINENTDVLLFNKSSLRGLTPEFLETLARDEYGNYFIDPRGHHYYEVSHFCEVEMTRRLVFTAWSNRGQKGNNSRLLAELSVMRKEVANILGYTNNMEYMTEILMSKNSTNVRNFLNSLGDKLKPKMMMDNEEYLEVKLKKCKEDNDTCTQELQMWDYLYMTSYIKKVNYTVHHNIIRQYFSLEGIKEKMLDFFANLFGLKFEQINETLWIDEVITYQVSDSTTGEVMGFIFMDLYTRPGKYSHAAVFPTQYPCRRPDGTREPSIALLVTNFGKSTPTTPSLLTYSQMKKFFHEFGHALHYLCAKPELKAFSGSEVERDFMEAPSQMLEYWLHEPDFLKNISSHYKNKTQLPDHLIESLLAAENFDLAYKTMRQLMFCFFDIDLNQNGTNDADQLYRDIVKQYMNVTIPEDIHSPGIFSPLAGNYAGQYYSFLWSEVYSADMYNSTFKTKGILNPTVGYDYRKKILEKGATRDAMDLLVDFLGRKPTVDAFLELKHLK